MPKKLAREYLNFTNRYWATLETCLDDYGTLTKEQFTEDYKKQDLKSNDVSLKKKVDEVLDYIYERINNAGSNIMYNGSALQKKDSDPIDNLNSIPINFEKNRHANPILLKKIEENLIDKMVRGAPETVKEEKPEEKEVEKKSNTDVNKARDTSNSTEKENVENEEEIEKPKVLYIKDLPDTTVESIGRSLRRIAEHAVVEDALDLIEERILFEGEYKFKKLVHSISDIYDDFILNKNSGKPKESLLEKKDSTLIKNVIAKYEVIGNRKYLKNKRKFESALRGSFLAQVKSAREVLKKEGKTAAKS